jgi:hypothetical protein
MFKELLLQNIWESDIKVENGSTFKIKSTLRWPVLVEGLKTGIGTYSQVGRLLRA